MIIIYTMKDIIPLFLFFVLQKRIYTYIVGTKTRTTKINTMTMTVDDTPFDCSSLKKAKAFMMDCDIIFNIMQCCKSESLTN